MSKQEFTGDKGYEANTRSRLSIPLPFDKVQIDKLNADHGLDMDRRLLDSLSRATLRLYSKQVETGGSAVIVSPDGLAATCYHCIYRAIASSPLADQIASHGFVASTREEELACDSYVAEAVIEAINVTAQVQQRFAGRVSDEKSLQSCFADYLDELNASMSKAVDEVLKPAIYLEGAEFWVFRIKQYTDVRLVFAPDVAAGLFGGQDDNFRFPRTTFDIAFVRLYENGRAAHTPNFRPMSFSPLKDGDPIFLLGCPLTSDRNKQVPELGAMRRFELPLWLTFAYELRGRYLEADRRGNPSGKAGMRRFFLENWMLIHEARLQALLDDGFWSEKQAQFQHMHRSAQLDCDGGERVAAAWENLIEAQSKREFLEAENILIGKIDDWIGDLAKFARCLVDFARLEIREARSATTQSFDRLSLDRRLAALRAQHEIDVELNALEFDAWCNFSVRALDRQHEIVKILEKRGNLAEFAKGLVEGSRLIDHAYRIGLIGSNLAQLGAVGDPMIDFFIAIAPSCETSRERYERLVEQPTRDAMREIVSFHETKDDAPFQIEADTLPRLAVGFIAGQVSDGNTQSPFTTIGDLYSRSAESNNSKLSNHWVEAMHKVDKEKVMNFITSNEALPGNSGSPLINKRGEVVGIAFDGNRHSIANTIRSDPNRARTIGVSKQAIEEVLDNIFDAQSLLLEIRSCEVHAST